MLDKAPDGKMSDLLNALDKALSAGEVERAVDLFQTDCYWRDLVTFTWNIKTMEGKEQVRDMLEGAARRYEAVELEDCGRRGCFRNRWNYRELDTIRNGGRAALATSPERTVGYGRC
jgi:hypothetical protein